MACPSQTSHHTWRRTTSPTAAASTQYQTALPAADVAPPERLSAQTSLQRPSSSIRFAQPPAAACFPPPSLPRSRNPTSPHAPIAYLHVHHDHRRIDRQTRVKPGIALRLVEIRRSLRVIFALFRHHQADPQSLHRSIAGEIDHRNAGPIGVESRGACRPDGTVENHVADAGSDHV